MNQSTMTRQQLAGLLELEGQNMVAFLVVSGDDPVLLLQWVLESEPAFRDGLSRDNRRTFQDVVDGHVRVV